MNIIEELDIKILTYIQQKIKRTHLDWLMPKITALGNMGIIWIVISFLLFRKEETKRIGIMIILALLLTTLVGEGIIKHIVRRNRPIPLLNEKKLLIKKPITFSFPSGHTASSFAVATVFIKTDSPLSLGISILAILIAFSRMYLNVHYPSDIIGGALIGSICGSIIVNLF